MNEPRVRYVTTPDDFRIAYTECGDGYPLVLMPQPMSHLSLFWRTPHQRAFFEALAARFRLIQYDGRGMGLSDRNLPDDFTHADLETDLSAVVDHLGLDQFLLFGTNGTNHAAVRYAVSEPGRVRALLLWQLLGDYRSGEPDILEPLARDHWERFLVTIAQIFLPGVEIERGVSILRAASSQADCRRMLRAAREGRINDVLPRLTMPVLLLYKAMGFGRTAEWSRNVASITPNSQMVALPDDGDLYGYPQDSRLLIEHIVEFTRGLAFKTEGRTRLALPLTAREAEVVRLIAAGETNKEIARVLVISERTVARHITNAYAKIGARGKADATAYAILHRLV